jgi:protein-disulfide isomerase
VPRHAPAPRRSTLLPFYIVLGVVALGGIVLLVRQFAGGGGSAATTMQQVMLTPEQLNRVPGIAQGRPDAPVTIMEFADFQCPACATFANFVKPLLDDHLRAGRVRFVWYDFPLVQIHRNAVLAARAGRCAHEQERFWPYHDVLFGRQASWSEAGGAVDLFVDYAAQAGLDRGAFSSCLRSDRYRQEVSENYQFGESLGVSGTPTLFVNGRRLGDIPRRKAEWDALVQEAMQGVSGPADPAAGS